MASKYVHYVPTRKATRKAHKSLLYPLRPSAIPFLKRGGDEYLGLLKVEKQNCLPNLLRFCTKGSMNGPGAKVHLPGLDSLDLLYRIDLRMSRDLFYEHERTDLEQGGRLYIRK